MGECDRVRASDASCAIQSRANKAASLSSAHSTGPAFHSTEPAFHSTGPAFPLHWASLASARSHWISNIEVRAPLLSQLQQQQRVIAISSINLLAPPLPSHPITKPSRYRLLCDRSLITARPSLPQSALAPYSLTRSPVDANTSPTRPSPSQRLLPPQVFACTAAARHSSPLTAV